MYRDVHIEMYRDVHIEMYRATNLPIVCRFSGHW